MTIALPRLAAISLTRKPAVVAVAMTPRANLLPPSVLAARKARATLRNIIAAVVGSVAVVAIGVGAASIAATTSSASLDAERARTDDLLTQQAQFSQISSALAEIAQLQGQEAIAGATDVEWTDYIGRIRAALSQGMAVTSLSVEATSPVGEVTQSTAPLQGARVASMTLTVSTPDLAALQTWLDALTGLPGYVDATPQSVSASTEGGLLASVVLNIGDGAYSGRFAQDEGAEK